MFGVPIADPPVRGNPTLPMRARPVALSRPKRYRLKRARSTQTCLDPSRCPRHPSPKRRAFRCVRAGNLSEKNEERKKDGLFLLLTPLRTFELPSPAFFYISVSHIRVYLCVCVWTHPFLRQESRATDNEHGPGSYAPIDSWVKKTYNVSYVRTWRLVPARNKTKAP